MNQKMTKNPEGFQNLQGLIRLLYATFIQERSVPALCLLYTRSISAFIFGSAATE